MRNYRNIKYLSRKPFAGRRTLLVRASILIALLFSIIMLRLLVAEVYQVKSNSMEEALYSGDIILVNKVQYGARLPLKVAHIPYAEPISYLFGFYKWAKSAHWKYRRNKGLGEIKHNDVLVFDGFKADEVLVKRCIGLPGDTLRITHNSLFINDTPFKEPPSIKLSYCLKVNGNIPPTRIAEVLGISPDDFIGKQGRYLRFSMTREKAAQVQENTNVDSIFIFDRPLGAIGPRLFSSTSEFKPTKENFGPLIIPAKGKRISLTLRNITVYRKLIVNDEQNALMVEGDSIFINGKISDSYIFSRNYYFVAGDNRYHSVDSRQSGFVPDSAIIGKVSAVLLSFDKNKSGLNSFRFNRIMKFSDL